MKIIFIIAFGLFFFEAGVAQESFIEKYPHLNAHTYKEPRSNHYLGVGIFPLGFSESKVLFGGSFFQLHWIKDPWDIEILNVSYSSVTTQVDTAQSNSFMMRLSPKYQVFSFLSLGPVLGWEFISFPKVSAKMFKNQFATPVEPFSSSGVVYGFQLSETFKFGETNLIKINQVALVQTYSTTETPEGWRYLYTDELIEADSSVLDAKAVFLLEVSYLF